MTMLDTHIAVALYEGRSAGLSAAARRLLDRGEVTISPAVVLELELLHEIGRLQKGGRTIADYLARSLDIPVASDRFGDVVDEALSRAFTRDPFDRLIVAHAALRRAALITHDRGIQHSCSFALA